jgi:hydroxymethylglutaryl-CoA reductase
MKQVSGFSKMSKMEKIKWVAAQIKEGEDFLQIDQFWHPNQKLQKVFDDFSENTVSNFFFPYGLAPNFLINENLYCVPMVIEESSVVAAASKSAKFWLKRGGFKAKVLGVTKVGHVHFIWEGDKDKLFDFFNVIKSKLKQSVKSITQNMEKRGGGLLSIDLVDKTKGLENYFQLEAKFNTCDAMGANFINSVLETFAQQLEILIAENMAFSDEEKKVDIIMSILSNYTPECIVHAQVQCPVEDLGTFSAGAGVLSAQVFASKFERACQIAKVDVSRAVTHNKGIYNGVDSVVLATGNDFRAIEACGHAYAAKDGQYRGLSSCSVKDGIFTFEITLPLALGTVGGLTALHPMAKMSLQLLDMPDAQELMKIAAVVGLAQNFGALRSLVTTGIQQGHMKMHLLNILNQLNASKDQIEIAKRHFEDKVVSYAAVREFLKNSSEHYQ